MLRKDRNRKDIERNYEIHIVLNNIILQFDLKETLFLFQIACHQDPNLLGVSTADLW